MPEPLTIAEVAKLKQPAFTTWLAEQFQYKTYPLDGSRVTPIAEWLSALCEKPIHVGAYSCSFVGKGHLMGHQPLPQWLKDLIAKVTDDAVWDTIISTKVAPPAPVPPPNNGYYNYAQPYGINPPPPPTVPPPTNPGWFGTSYKAPTPPVPPAPASGTFFTLGHWRKLTDM